MHNETSGLLFNYYLVYFSIIIYNYGCLNAEKCIFILTFVKGRMPETLGTNISSTKPFYDKVRLGLLPYCYFVAGNQLRVLLAILTNINITGTSTSTPTTVANAAPDCKPKREIATATANSKKLLAPIIPAGAATSWGNFHHFAQP